MSQDGSRVFHYISIIVLKNSEVNEAADLLFSDAAFHTRFC